MSSIDDEEMMEEDTSRISAFPVRFPQAFSDFKSHGLYPNIRSIQQIPPRQVKIVHENDESLASKQNGKLFIKSLMDMQLILRREKERSMKMNVTHNDSDSAIAPSKRNLETAAPTNTFKRSKHQLT